jgi:hypothetical protein
VSHYKRAEAGVLKYEFRRIEENDIISRSFAAMISLLFIKAIV